MIKILISLLLFLSVPVIAEQEDEASTTNINNEQTRTTETKPTNSTAIRTPDSFDPTETLSQDVPTAFPVDI